MEYGKQPSRICPLEFPEWTEMLHYLYLPVVMEGSEIRLPRRLEFARTAIRIAMAYARPSRYIYLTARRGFATPDNPINRPGWHTDGFGTDDENFVWCDRWGTQIAGQKFTDISTDHRESARQFEDQVVGQAVYPIRTKMLYYFDPFVVHNVPYIPAPGGMRSFMKISFSPYQYNLIGNSHNHLFDYEWEMFDRDEVRNDPHYAGGDYR